MKLGSQGALCCGSGTSAFEAGSKFSPGRATASPVEQSSKSANGSSGYRLRNEAIAINIDAKVHLGASRKAVGENFAEISIPFCRADSEASLHLKVKTALAGLIVEGNDYVIERSAMGILLDRNPNDLSGLTSSSFFTKERCQVIGDDSVLICVARSPCQLSRGASFHFGHDRLPYTFPLRQRAMPQPSP